MSGIKLSIANFGAFISITLSLALFTLAPPIRSAMPAPPHAGGVTYPATLMAAAAPSATSSLNQVIEAAKKEGEVMVLVTQGILALTEKEFIAGVNRKWGVNLKIVFTPTSGVFARDLATLTSEIDAGRAPSWDVATSTAPALRSFQKRGFIQTVEWSRIFSHITPKMQEHAMGGVIYHAVWYIPYYNTRVISPDDLGRLPKRWEDFLDPRWRGKLLHPLGSFMQTILATEWGEEKTREFVKQLAKQDMMIGRFPEMQMRLFAGERPLQVYSNHPADHFDAQKKGAPVKLISGINPQPIIYYSGVIPKNARHSNAAQLFLAYLLTLEGQELLWKAGHSSPLVAGAPMEKYLKEMEAAGSKVITYKDLDQAERLFVEYNNILGIK